jgi:DNA-binding transcriptional LysR family regulator
MELRHLRYFVAVAEELHFRRAAERLHVAQPAVSEQIRKLEQELGVRLFERSQGVSLTAGGKALLIEARHVLRQADAAMTAARNAHEDACMRLRIGYLPDSLPASVPRALRHLVSAAPRVHAELEPGQAQRLIEDLRAGRLHAVVTSLPAPTARLRVTQLGPQRAVAVLPAGHALAVEPELAIEWITRERLLVLPRSVDPPFRDALVAMCREADIAPDFFEVGNAGLEDALLAVAAGAGIALMPESVAERYTPPGIRFIPLQSRSPAIQCAVLTDPEAEHLGVRALLRALTRIASANVTDSMEAANALVA